jgi:uncharacterized CHY-type Zn-finger protein
VCDDRDAPLDPSTDADPGPEAGTDAGARLDLDLDLDLGAPAAGDADLDPRFDVPLRGVDVDAETRCAHYATDRDRVAIRFPCCDVFYPCHACHDARADHPPERWPRDRFDEPAVLCGACGRRLSVAAYLACGHRCPACDAAFNPGCAAHADRYFAGADDGGRDDEGERASRRD